MRFLSLFAGIGGFDLGLERSGMECVGQVENDPYCLKVLEKHWPNAKRLTDIRGVKGDEFGPVDLICGGFPCQPWSAAGKQRGTEDDRDLWPEMLRVIEAVRPRWVVGENVRGFVSMEMGLDRSISDLEAIGYAVQAFVVPACAVDAPHRRDRCWVVANSGSNGRFRIGLKEHAKLESASGDQPNGLRQGRRGQGKDVADTDGSGCQQQRGAKSARAELPAAERGGDVADAKGEPKRPRLRKGGKEKERGRRSGDSGGNVPNSQVQAFVRGDGQLQATEQIEGWGPDNGAGTQGDGRRWRLESDVGRVAHGIPKRVDRLRALGNAVVPQIPEIIGRAILQAEGMK